MPCETKWKVSKVNTKAKKEKKKRKRTEHKYHKAVLKSICISTGYPFSNKQTKLEVCINLEKQKQKKTQTINKMLMLKCDYILHKYSVPSIQMSKYFWNILRDVQPAPLSGEN